MILPDVNTLVYAFHRDTKEHEPAPQSARTATRNV